jgi:flagellar hook assembly protein FlgD
MEQVKVLVKSDFRQGDVARSENFSKDRWDGTDKGGVEVAPGMYYVHVASDKGESGWGKVMIVKGKGR